MLCFYPLGVYNPASSGLSSPGPALRTSGSVAAPAARDRDFDMSSAWCNSLGRYWNGKPLVWGTHILGNLHLEPLCVFIFPDKWLTCDPVAKKKYRSCRTCIRRVQNGWPGDHYCPPERRFTTYPCRVAQQNAATLVCRKRRVWMPKMDENGPKLHIFPWLD